MADATDPIRNLTNSGNPVLASLGGLAAAATSIARGGLRGENNFTEIIEIILAYFFKPGRPGDEQVRVVLAGGTELTRRWFIINWRKQGYCGLHNIINNEESNKIEGECKAHGCVNAHIVKEQTRTTVAYTTEGIIPEGGYLLGIHSPCCPTYAEKLPCPPDHDNWCFVTNGPSFKVEMNRMGLDISTTVDEHESNYCGPAANAILNNNRSMWYRIGSRRHPHNILLLNGGEALLVLLLAWYSSAGPLLCGIAARKGISSFWNGPNNRGTSLALLEDDAYLFLDNGNATTYAVVQSKTHVMLYKILWTSFVNLIVTIGAYTIMELKSRVIKPSSEDMEKERKITIAVLAIVIFIMCFIAIFRPIQGNAEEVRGGRWLAAFTGLVAVGVGMIAPWIVKGNQYKNIRLALEIYCMLAIILVKIAWWGQQYIHGGAIDPRNYYGVEGAIYVLSGLASLYVVVDLYSN